MGDLRPVRSGEDVRAAAERLRQFIAGESIDPQAEWDLETLLAAVASGAEKDEVIKELAQELWDVAPRLSATGGICWCFNTNPVAVDDGEHRKDCARRRSLLRKAGMST